MNISSALSSFAFNTQVSAEGRIEGNKPDGDGDKDDKASVARPVSQSSPSAQITATLGNFLNTTA